MKKNPVLLIVDDEKATREGLRLAMEEDFDVFLAANTAEAGNVMKHDDVDLVLTDLRLGGDSGMDVLDEAMRQKRPPVAIMMTAYGSVDTAVEAMRRGAWHFVTKPLNLDEVEMLLKRAMKSRTLENENRELKQVVEERHGLKNLLGKSLPMQRMIESVEQVAPTRATVLIEGESGTGKEVVAHTLHQLSGRPVTKFVVVHCAALSPQLLESELFGHEKGSFTGATQRRLGRFEQADGGTIFLDEIGEIDAATQVKLLRVLSERTVERVGSNVSVKVDVRVVAATNKNLKQLVEAGEFREDLYFRLNVIKIDMPPLRERGEDVVLLAAAFLREFAKENRKPIAQLSESSLSLIKSYDWPGNVRELRTVIEHGVVMCTGGEILPSHLPTFLQQRESQIEMMPALANLTSGMPVKNGNGWNLAELEKRAICGALREVEGNRTLAATLLGISRRTLQRKILELQLES